MVGAYPRATASTNSTESTFRNALVPGKMLNSKGSVVWPNFKSRVMKSHPQRYYARERSTTTPEYAPARTTEPTFVDALTHGNNTHTPRVFEWARIFQSMVTTKAPPPACARKRTTAKSRPAHCATSRKTLLSAVRSVRACGLATRTQQLTIKC